MLNLSLITVVIVVLVNLKIGFNYKFKYIEYHEIIKFGLPIGLSFAIAALYTRLDQLLVFRYLGEEAAGIYGLAARLMLILKSFSWLEKQKVPTGLISLKKYQSQKSEYI